MEQTVKRQTEVDVFAEEFPARIKAWLDSAKFRTPYLLSKLTNIRPNTIYDLMKGRRSVAKLHPSRIIRILSCLDGVEQNEVMKNYKEILGAIEKGCGDSELKVDLELSGNTDFTKTFVQVMKNPVALAIYTMSLREKGISSNTVREQYGAYGEQILKDLLENHLMLKSGSCYFPINKEFVRLNRDQVQEMIPVLNTFYNSKHSNQDRNYTTMRVDSINRKALYEIYDLFAFFDNRLTEILADEVNKGEIPFYHFAQMDTMINEI
jgi:hypothetical protein